MLKFGSTPRILWRSSSFNCSPAVWLSGLACCGVADPALLLSCEPPVGGGLDACGASGRVELSDASRTDTGEASSKTSGCNDGLWAHTRGLRQTSPNSKRCGNRNEMRGGWRAHDLPVFSSQPLRRHTVAQVSYSNGINVSKQVVMMTLSAQARYAAGTREIEILESRFEMKIWFT